MKVTENHLLTKGGFDTERWFYHLKGDIEVNRPQPCSSRLKAVIVVQNVFFFHICSNPSKLFTEVMVISIWRPDLNYTKNCQD